MNTIYYVMGVAGCGKSTVGMLLSERLQIPFYDADDFHPASNVEKMKKGVPLNDEDRKGWLAGIHTFVSEEVNSSSLVFACSALKAKYRKQLSEDLHSEWIYLEGTFDEIERRMKAREGHYMPPSLLKSQFETLEPPTEAISISIQQSPKAIVEHIMLQIEKKSSINK